MSTEVRTTVSEYEDDSIITASDAEWILMRPENHVRVTDDSGLAHVLREILDNSTDETELFPGGKIDILFFLDKKNNTYQVAIHDNGRGIPFGKFLASFTKLKTSGKFTKDAYQTSGGLNGFGGKVAQILSENFRAITYRDGRIASIGFHRTELQHHTEDNFVPGISGTLVIHEPRKGYFTKVDRFIEETHNSILKLTLLLSMFSRNTTITTRMVFKSVDPSVWELPAREAMDLLDKKYRDIAIIATDGADNDSAMRYLRELWNVDSPFTWTMEKINSSVVPELEYKKTKIHTPMGIQDVDVLLAFNISLFLPKIMRGTCTTSIVNNIPTKDQTSSHVVGLISALKSKLVGYIEIPEHKQFFLDYYKIPLCAAISVKYGNVRYTSLAKDGFKDSEFEARYIEMLVKAFDMYEPYVWDELYQHIEDHIVLHYEQFYNKPISSKSAAKKVSLEIIDRKFYDCSTSDRSKAELIIVEGVSASHAANKRDTKTQAVFMIRGKPLNVTKTSTGKHDPMSRLNSYPPYVDLMKILNISPTQTDLSTANYGKIILMQDADTHGDHIRALHIGGLYAINPLIIESGMVYLANPPLYEITFGNKKKFVRSKPELISFRIEGLYRPTLTIKIQDYSKNAFATPVTLQGEEFRDFCQIVVAVGEIYSELSAQLAIPEIILEKLSMITAHIQPNRVNVDILRTVFGRTTRYNPHLNILTISHGHEDISFPLDGVTEALYEEILGIQHKLAIRHMKILVSTNFVDLLNDTHVSLVQLYLMFEQLNKKFKVDRNKGLGGMDAEDLEYTCLNPVTRHLHHIKSIGDYQKIYELLGDDTKARKKLLEDHGLLD